MATTPRVHRRLCLATGSALFLSTVLEGSSTFAAAEELAVIVHPSNKASLSMAEIAAIFKTTRRFWSGSTRIVAMNLPAGSRDRALFDRVVLGLNADAAVRFWIDRKIRGGEPQPRNVPEAEVVLSIVQQVETAIGYVPAHLVRVGVRVIARVRDNGAEVGIGSSASGDL
jgi:ABC-type phosphate transport system substrate-binding protein